LELQFPLIARLQGEHALTVETLAESGRWFRERYTVTPVTTFTVERDLDSSDKKTVWFDSRYYRINIIWEKGTLRVRDIHLFNEDIPSIYETRAVDSTDCRFFTLPFVDGYVWSKPNRLAGLRLMARKEGKTALLQGYDPGFTARGDSVMHIQWPLRTVKGSFVIDLRENQMEITWTGQEAVDWFFELSAAEGAPLPFGSIRTHAVACRFEGKDYQVSAIEGMFLPTGNGSVFRIRPKNNKIVLNFDTLR
jgi:hypothetical protein